MQLLFFVLSILLCTTSGLASQPDAEPPAARPPVVPPDPESLVSMEAALTIDVIHPGDKFFIAVSFDIEESWHIYWSNPGETGNATQVFVEAPEGFTVGDALLPRPEDIPAMFRTYGYEHGAILFVPIEAPESLDISKPLKFIVEAGWLVCKESCYLGDDTKVLAAKAVMHPRTTAADVMTVDFKDEMWFITNKEHVELFTQRIPRNIEFDDDVAINIENNRIVIEGPIGKFDYLEYFPDNSVGVKTELVSSDIARGEFRVVIDVTFDGNSAGDTPPVAAGVVALGRAMDDPSYSFEIEVR